MRRAARGERGTGLEIPALLLVAVWAGGFELAPALHALDHLEGAHHAHGHAHADDPPEEGPDPQHGEGALEHRDLAARGAPPALPPIGPGALVAVTPRPAPAVLSSRVDVVELRARGPPA